MAEHTPTPWRVERGTDLIWGACNPDDMTTYGMGYAIVCGTTSSYTGGKPSIDEREANADFIIKACNSHDALVKALEGMVLVCGRTGDSFTDFEEQAEAFYQEIGCMRPGKSVPMEMDRDDHEERRIKYNAWVQIKIEAGRDALKAVEQSSHDSNRGDAQS
ncbi:hypothetical protein [Tardiphaga sp. 709]|uniref:hypothetical protein n=1 Tax=Tardiphaga sp. 709 TaxID=3076039 RepID=UPI0028E58099|nr:hypothetical protein [Tardiphaga sp. 709]WNV09993.1 hypothetical protein RSO67_01990 [Tardiphaga sp. 709]